MPSERVSISFDEEQAEVLREIGRERIAETEASPTGGHWVDREDSAGATAEVAALLVYDRFDDSVESEEVVGAIIDGAIAAHVEGDR